MILSFPSPLYRQYSLKSEIVVLNITSQNTRSRAEISTRPGKEFIIHKIFVNCELKNSQNYLRVFCFFNFYFVCFCNSVLLDSRLHGNDKWIYQHPSASAKATARQARGE